MKFARHVKACMAQWLGGCIHKVAVDHAYIHIFSVRLRQRAPRNGRPSRRGVRRAWGICMGGWRLAGK